jgi:hypothetical protein
MRLQFVTGADARSFAQLCILLGAFAEMPGGSMPLVCDFGLMPEHRRFLERRVPVRPMARYTGGHDHPWFYKASIGDALAGDDIAPVWLDADLLPTRDPTPDATRILEEMKATGQAIAACPAWKQIAFRNPEYTLFEQNALNVTAWQAPDRLRLLDGRQWNAHGRHLGLLSIEPVRVLCDGVEALLLHATSPRKRFLEFRTLTWRVEGSLQRGEVRFFADPELGRRQLDLLGRFLSSPPRY